jgi:hypothetical protein
MELPAISVYKWLAPNKFPPISAEQNQSNISVDPDGPTARLIASAVYTPAVFLCDELSDISSGFDSHRQSSSGLVPVAGIVEVFQVWQGKIDR